MQDGNVEQCADTYTSDGYGTLVCTYDENHSGQHSEEPGTFHWTS